MVALLISRFMKNHSPCLCAGDVFTQPGSDADVVVLCLHSGSKRTADVKESASDGEPLGRSDNERCGRRGAHADRRLSTVRPCGFGSGQSSNQQHLHGRLNRQELHGSPSIRSDRFKAQLTSIKGAARC